MNAVTIIGNGATIIVDITPEGAVVTHDLVTHPTGTLRTNDVGLALEYARQLARDAAALRNRAYAVGGWRGHHD